MQLPNEGRRQNRQTLLFDAPLLFRLSLPLKIPVLHPSHEYMSKDKEGEDVFLLESNLHHSSFTFARISFSSDLFVSLLVSCLLRLAEYQRDSFSAIHTQSIVSQTESCELTSSLWWVESEDDPPSLLFLREVLHPPLIILELVTHILDRDNQKENQFSHKTKIS